MEPIRMKTVDASQTEAIAAELARTLQREGKTDAFLALYGDLGAGKTAFVRGLASVLTPSAAVSSPTYTIVNEYREGEVTLCHFDMYRITSEEDLYSIGFYDYENCFIAVEWSENIPFALPPRYYRITIQKEQGEGFDSGVRILTIEEVQA